MNKLFLNPLILFMLAVSAYGGPIIFDFSSGHGLITYAGISFGKNMGFYTGVNTFQIFINGGLEYNAFGTNDSFEGYVGISPLLITAGLLRINNPGLWFVAPNIFQTQIGYGGSGMVLKFRSDLNVSRLFQKNQAFPIPCKKERRGINRLMLSAGYEYFPKDILKNNWQIGLGLIF